MKILINEGLSTLGNLTGIGNVSYNLWTHLNKIVDCDLTNYYYLRAIPRIIRRQLYIAIVNFESILNNKYDIIHFQNYYTPKPFGKTIQVATIHDLSVFEFPQSYPKHYLPYITRAIINTLNRVEAIITPSENAKNILLKLFHNIPEHKVSVIFNGVNDIFYKHTQPDKNTYENESFYNDGFFLFVGTLEHRKNISFLLDTFIKAHNSSAISKNTKLMVVGKAGFGFNEIKNKLQHKNIIWLQNIQNDNLVGLYKSCKGFIMPSLYEGFGIPVAEAIVTQTPIIASNIPTNIEFNNRHNNGLYTFELNNENRLIELLSYIDNNIGLRNNLNYGDVSLYSYDKVAQKHLDLYNSILTTRNSGTTSKK